MGRHIQKEGYRQVKVVVWQVCAWAGKQEAGRHKNHRKAQVMRNPKGGRNCKEGVVGGSAASVVQNAQVVAPCAWHTT